MAPLNRKIEERSLLALRNIIGAHPTMEGYFNERDKELSWDGFIRLYQRDDLRSDSKSNFDDDVPVQIKGHVDKERKFMDKDRITTAVDLDDLRNYFRKFGCIYFVIYMSEDGSEVELFYSSLYPSKIKVYLEEAERRGNKATINLPFVKLEKDCNELYLLCKQFSFEVKKQGSGDGQIVPRAITGEGLRQVKKITATSVGGTTPYDLLKRINTGDAVLYGTVDDTGIQYPMQMRQMLASVKQTFEAPVFIGDRQYYSSFEMESTVAAPDVKNFIREGTHTIKPSPNIVLTFKRPDIHFKFSFESDIPQLKHDAEFILDLLDKLELTVFEEKIPMGNPKVDAELLKQLHDLIEAGNVLEDIGCNVLVPFKELTDDDKAQIDLLCAIKAGRVNFKTDQNVFLYNWKFRGKKLPIIIDQKEHKIAGYVFNTHVVFSVGCESNEEHPETLPDDAYIVPNFLRTEPELLANLYYYDYESMYEQVDRSVYNDYTQDEINVMALNLVKAYDLSDNTKLLDVAGETLRRLLDVYPKTVNYHINLAQIEVRKNGVLSDDTKQKLETLQVVADALPKPENDEQSDIGKVYTYCFAVLKGDLEEADNIYRTLTEADKSGVDGWPIRTLHQKLADRKN